MDERKQEYIDRYIKNEMSVQERQCFEERLVSDAELREQYEFTLQVQTVLRSRAEKLERMKDWDNASAEKNTMIANRKRTGWVAAVILTAAAAWVGGTFLLPDKEVKMPPLDQSGWELYRSGDNLSQIAALIQEEHYAEALQVIDEKEKNVYSFSRKSSPVTDEERERMEYEQKVARLNAYHMKWLKVYALVGLGRMDEALEVLDFLRKEEGVYQMQADSLYRLMK